MWVKRLLLTALVLLLCGAGLADSGEPPGSVTPQVQELLQKMLGDEQTMALVLSLKDDPEMQAVLEDPAVLAAIQSGDLAALTANPRFMKLLDNAKVNAIQKRVGQ